MIKFEDIRYVITNDNEDKFYKMGTYFVVDILSACLYDNMELPQYHLSRCMNSFQKNIFTKIIPVYIIISNPPEKE